MNDCRKFNKYIVFWLTQSLSELGSSMTSFALVMWAYGQTGSALSVSLGILVPEEYRSRASGMSSFSSSLITVVTPMLAAALFFFGGLKGILFIDLLTFLLGAGILFFFISIPEASLKEQIGEKQGPFTGFLWGWRFLKAHKGILCIILSMSMLNFFSRLTYENILSPMIPVRSQSSSVLGIVTGILGAGDILGGILGFSSSIFWMRNRHIREISRTD